MQEALDKTNCAYRILEACVVFRKEAFIYFSYEGSLHEGLHLLVVM